MRRTLAVAVSFTLIGSACLGGGADERVVLVDFSHDEFASLMVDNFPGEVSVTPGMTIVFRQTWTGEPHTVTAGSLVDEMMKGAVPWIDFFDGFEKLAATGDLPNPEAPQGSVADLFERIDAADNEEARESFYRGYDALREQGVALPDREDPGDTSFEELVNVIDEAEQEFFGDTGVPAAAEEKDGEFYVTQNAGQPCYLTEGGPPEDADEPCPRQRQSQPVFDGTASYYNSGIIPYEGPQGNTFRVQIADDIEPGNYWFYCAVHGPQQTTQVKVRPPGTDIPSQEDVSRQARKEIDDYSAPMVGAWRDAQDGKIEMDGETIDGPFAGLVVPVFGAINEFIPKRIETEVGRPVRWKIMGWDHSVSFDVPEYFPIVRFAENGNVSLNPELGKPAGGSPDLPEEGGPPEALAGTENREPEILSIDGGTYDGSGFFSSGLFTGEPYAQYTLRFSKAGTYRYACLLHPSMVGTVVVT